ncbi:unnamed protein product [Ixodes hexagonus]
MKLGCWKNEMPTEHILSFVGLKPKLYALKLSSSTQYNRAKGVKKSKARLLCFEKYLKALETQSLHRVSQNLIMRKHNENKSVSMNKIALSPLDTKRYIELNGLTTLPYGHYKIA